MARVALVLVAALAFAGCHAGGTPGVRGLAPAGDDPFGAGATVPGVFRAVLSPSGGRLAVLTDGGLGRVERNRIVPITQEGAHVVDVAWFPNSATVLVAEGPTPTGEVAVVDVTGKVRGSIRLDPSVGFGGGYGMSVAPDGHHAVVSAVDRPPLEAEHRFLVAVDLTTGATRPLTPAGGPDESGPVHLSENLVAFVERDGERVRTRVVDVTTGAIDDAVDGMAVVGASGGRPVVVDAEGNVSVGGRRLGSVPAGSTVEGVDVAGKQAVVVESTPAGARARRIEL
jgi:hypothetical protein